MGHRRFKGKNSFERLLCETSEDSVDKDLYNGIPLQALDLFMIRRLEG